METITKAPVTFTIGAINEILRLKQDPSFDSTKELRIGVKGGGCSGLSYLLGFDDRNADDTEYNYEGISFILNKAHELYLIDMQIDWENGLNNRGFTFKNPNASATCGCGTSFAI